MSEAKLRLTNTLTRTKEEFVPIDPANVRMYVCGPTVYDYAHIGNARPVIVFDVLFRLLRHLYGADHVTYVRNITDVDDKINVRALRDFGPEIEAGRITLNEAIRKVTETTADQFHEDVAALGCLEPTHEPRATEFVLPRQDGKADMATLIQKLIDGGHAYEANGEILFDVASMPDYGQLSRRNLDEQQAGARVAVDAHKRSPADFVLWKGSSAEEPGWEAEFRLPDRTVAIRGRPGWHIECSAMSAAYLGETFDIHGGGLDLIFPHHENEIAQSRCAHGAPVMANYWLHNGFLQVEGRKMAKSEGNFVTIHELLTTEKFGGRKWPGEVLRLAMLMTHYREPIDFSVRRLEEAEARLRKWLTAARDRLSNRLDSTTRTNVTELLCDDLDVSSVLTYLDKLTRSSEVYTALKFLGFNAGLSKNSAIFRNLEIAVVGLSNLSESEWKNIREKSYREQFTPEWGIAEYMRYLSEKVAPRARLRLEGNIDQFGIDYIESRRKPKQTYSFVDQMIAERLAFIREKNWAEADRIRDDLLKQGIQLKDGKDPATGERVTTWEVKR